MFCHWLEPMRGFFCFLFFNQEAPGSNIHDDTEPVPDPLGCQACGKKGIGNIPFTSVDLGPQMVS